ncbi:cell division protein FtsK [Nocardia salmonicida]|uniref:cell division protein FtsK n=1 Tax=Nocardia salmonicida TaxID=53431 RepID=UPI001041F5F9|nr:cell division protein FtsK [Nocardia salmonicida]
MARSDDFYRNQQPATTGDQLGLELMHAIEVTTVLAARILLWSFIFPMLSLPVIGAIAVGWWLSWPVGLVVGLAAPIGWIAWARLWPDSWERRVTGRIRARHRIWSRYRRRWSEVTAMHGLSTVLDTEVRTPLLARVTPGPVADILDIKMLDGQTREQWAKQSDAQRHSFAAVGVRVRLIKPGWLRLEVVHVDILTTPIPLPREELNSVDLEALTVGITELGEPWSVRLLGNQLLVAGATGSGKGSVAWSLLAALGPGIRDGVVIVWVIDPKGGMEFGYARKWFARFASDSGSAALQILEDAMNLVQVRGERYRDNRARKITPTVDEPLVLLLVDEAATLTAYYADRKIKDSITRCLGVILTQSRAVAVPVVGCLQDPSKEVLELRQLFPYRIGLRLREYTQPDMVFGKGGRDRGALCDEIPESMPGVGYVEHETSNDITRVRAFNVTNDDIDWIISTYPPLLRDADGNPLRGDGRPEL